MSDDSEPRHGELRDAPVEVVPYDVRWPEVFRQERQLLSEILQPWLAGPIEHIGSTAVPGLPAKPVIDIMAGVASLDESRGAIAAVRAAGYLYAPYRVDERHWFCKPHFTHRTHHLHLVPVSSCDWKRCLKFRDLLRSVPAVAAEYADLKLRLAVIHRLDREAYTDAKWPFIEKILQQLENGMMRGE